MSQLSSVSKKLPANTLQRLRKFSRLLDNAIGIPGTKFRIGLDPILGLLPGAGDFVGTALSAYIVVEAVRMGVPRNILGRMVGNIILESVVGTVPVLGDFFDFAWKANTKNMELLEMHFNYTENKKTNWLFVSLLLLGLLCVGIGLAALSVLVIRLIVNSVTGAF